ITSGSFGEGLQMRGSDIDIMYVLTIIEVHDKIKSIVFNPIQTYFVLTTEDTKAGFAMLHLIRSQDPTMLKNCEKFRKDFYLSNALFKQLCLTDRCPVEHGPCVSDKEGYSDYAYCLHSKSWIQPASKWIMRSNNSWPNENTKQMIINHGVLFVPIGAKGSEHEELEWRISFSVAEKFLIYTFSHAQFTCYALMKILLKDVINADKRIKNVLCSYHLKTILYWISEEKQPSVWTPDNLIPCFMRCFRRLIYCVEYSVCPHYFIPENDLFKNKIEGLYRDNLNDTLRVLYSYGWRCILFSNQISHVSVLSCNIPNDHNFLYYEDINKLLKSKIFALATVVNGTQNNFGRAIYNIISCFSKKLKYIHAFFISIVCCKSICLSSAISNKNHYKQYNTCLSYLLMNINHYIASGWLLVASFFL
ncbi:cyclic GMP-AMP synthase-like, partial [Mytilus californianus]|uniref:cyclic GMP-AMP synthase-like n=1 Tax=Mytilus californianus TaxID=6549 RepID=UPI002245FE91